MTYLDVSRTFSGLFWTFLSATYKSETSIYSKNRSHQKNLVFQDLFSKNPVFKSPNSTLNQVLLDQDPLSLFEIIVVDYAWNYLYGHLIIHERSDKSGIGKVLE